MRILRTILLIIPLLNQAQQFYIGDTALVHISEGANLEVGGDLENEGVLENVGTLSLYGDWLINDNFNGLAGNLQFLGGSDQMITIPELTISGLTIRQGGTVTFPGDEYEITERIEFREGIIEIGDDTRFVLGENARVIGGSNISYFNGTCIWRGSGIRTFPVGSNGVFSPLTLLNVFGNDVELAASFTSMNPVDPVPGDSLLGVSHDGVWQVDLVNGVVDETDVQVEFSEVDLTNFRNPNNIRHLVNSPVIAFTFDLNEEWETLGVQELLDTDSTTFGTLTAERSILPTEGQTLYLAVGLAPRIPNEGLSFIPDVFSPNASDPINQTFKILGERIVDQDFSLQIYNRLGVLVYETTSFTEANEVGWNGTNQSGGEEPTGIYYYTVRFKFITDSIEEKSGAFYLIR